MISLKDTVRAERERVAAIIRRDQIDRQRKKDREAAEMELAEGVFVNLADAVVEPTPEWLAKGDTRPFTPRSPDGTARSVKSVRRVVTPIVLRLWSAGKLTDDQVRACMWYRAKWDQAGLEGRWSSMKLGGVGGGAGATPSTAGHIAMTQEEAEARRAVREARAAITAEHPDLIRLFESVVAHDISLSRAARFVKCRNGNAFPRFRVAAQALLVYLEGSKIELPKQDADCDR